MCGIAGVFGNSFDKSASREMLQAIEHRGESLYCQEEIVGQGICMGTNRLAIVDEQNGRQPLTTLNGRYSCCMNGEIYNHRELKKQLSNHYRFTSDNDTEVCLAAWVVWGRNFVHRIEGMYAIAIYDHLEHSFLLIRDCFGIKPLYYSKVDQAIYFCSELKGLASLPHESPINLLSPGSIYNGKEEVSFYSPTLSYQSSTVKFPISEHSVINLLHDTLRDSIMKMVPPNCNRVACLLSGGVDSSMLLKLLCKYFDGEIIAYTFSLDPHNSSDLMHAKMLTAELGVKHEVVIPSESDLTLNYLTLGVSMTETFEPALVRNAVSYHSVCKRIAKDGFKWCLSGEGADEVFGGYDYFRDVENPDEAILESLRNIHKTYLQMSDRASMHTTLEVRVPYMEKCMVDFVYGLPPEYRIRDGQDKWILRRLYALDGKVKSIGHKVKLGMNAGAGAGSNDGGTGIYYEAVKSLYCREPELYQGHFKSASIYGGAYSINVDDLEEVYNFAQYLEKGFGRYGAGNKRVQLNTVELVV